MLELAASDSARTAAVALSAGPVDRVLLGWQTFLSRTLGRLPPAVRLIVVAIVFALPIIAVVMARQPLTLGVLSLAMVLGVLEATILAATRTISVRTVFVAASVGAGFVSLATVMTVGGLEAVFGLTQDDPRSVSRALFTPLVEELLKLAPAILVLAGSRRARTMTVIDFGLLGFASGIGFSLTEEVLRSGVDEILANVSPLPALLAFPANPYAAWVNARWFGDWQFFSHSLTTASVAIAIGLSWRAARLGRRRAPWVVLAGLLLTYVIALHIRTNADVVGSLWPAVHSFVDLVGQPDILMLVAGVMALGALVIDAIDLGRATDGPFLSLFLPLPGRIGFASGLLDARVPRLVAARRAYGMGGQALDPWTANALGHARLTGGLLLLAIAAIGFLVPGATPPVAGCTNCVWDPQAGLPWWLLAFLSLGLDLLPGIGDLKGLTEAATGKDFVTGEKVPWWARALGALPLLGGLVRVARGLARGGRVAGALADGAAAARLSDGASVGRMQSRGAKAGWGAVDDALPGAGARHADDLRPLPSAARDAAAEARQLDLAAARGRAEELAQKARDSGQPVVANIGGAGAPHEPAHGININNQAVARRDIPNLVEADGADIGSLFAPGSVDRIEGHRMAPGVIKWDKAAPGALEVLKPGGTFSYGYRASNPDAMVLADALREAGFRNVVVIGQKLEDGVWVGGAVEAIR